MGHGPLREPLELLAWALGRGDRALAERIVELGGALEGSEEKPLETARLFFEALDGRELDRYFERASARCGRRASSSPGT